MQFNPPVFYVPNDQRNYNSPPAFNIPEVIGEGDVVSTVYPDGTNYFFIPTGVLTSAGLGYKRIEPLSPNGSWFIKNVVNVINAAPNVQTLHKGVKFQDSGTINVNSQLHEEPFALKFHNDFGTSTTDLHYFYPTLRCEEWVPKMGANVQVSLPTVERSINHYEYITKLEASSMDDAMCIDEPPPVAVKRYRCRNACTGTFENKQVQTTTSKDTQTCQATKHNKETKTSNETITCKCSDRRRRSRKSERKPSKERCTCGCENLTETSSQTSTQSTPSKIASFFY